MTFILLKNNIHSKQGLCEKHGMFIYMDMPSTDIHGGDLHWCLPLWKVTSNYKLFFHGENVVKC